MFLVMALSVCFLVATASRSPKSAAERGGNAVLVELFTSEGCSSCPPADSVLSQLIAEQPVEGAFVIGLGEHVDYWNGLGWKDPFSNGQFTKRQQFYAQAFRSGNIYTPQMVVDGRDEFVGSDRRKAIAAIRSSLSEERVAVDLLIRAEEPSHLEVRIGQRPPSLSGKARVMMAVTEENLQSDVSRGENRGLVLKHAAVVRQLSQIGELEAAQAGAYSTSATLDLSPDWKIDDLKIVVFVQRDSDLRVLGAAAMAPQTLRAAR